MQTTSSCPDRVALNRLADGTAGADEERVLREHLANCPHCRDVAGQTVDLGYTLSAPPFGDGATVDVNEIAEIGSYRVIRKIGQGGMGVVLEAEDPRLRRRVAIKVLRPTLAIDPLARERFLREARAVAAVQHDHVVSIFQVGEQDGMPFLVMPLLPGESLDNRLQRLGGIPLNESVRIAAEAAEGLAAAHARGVVHRDIKPANIWLEDRGPGRSARTRLLDFGLARGGPDERTLTMEGMVVGTPAYMSPEQALGQPLDAKTDLYSLGAVLFRMVLGSIPTASSAANEIAANGTIPSELGRWMQRLLDRDPNKRPDSARDVADRLNRIAGSLGHDRSRGRFVRLLAAAGLLVVIAILFVLWRRGELTPGAVESLPTTPIRNESPPPDPKEKDKDTTLPIQSPEILAAQWARKHGGTVHFRDGEISLVIRPNDALPEQAIRLYGIELSGNKEFQSDELKVLVGLDRLNFITLDHSNLDNEGAKHLAGLAALDKLYLSNTNITDDGLRSLAGLKNLRVLKLALNKIGDDGMIHLQDLSALDELWLDGTNVTDVGLRHLRKLPRIKVLRLTGTQVTMSTKVAFQTSKPGCQVTIGPLDPRLERFK
jgi:serine/threonine protein kinase